MLEHSICLYLNIIIVSGHLQRPSPPKLAFHRVCPFALHHNHYLFELHFGTVDVFSGTLYTTHLTITYEEWLNIPYSLQPNISSTIEPSRRKSNSTSLPNHKIAQEAFSPIASIERPVYTAVIHACNDRKVDEE
jgi:hypothetical protein